MQNERQVGRTSYRSHSGFARRGDDSVEEAEGLDDPSGNHPDLARLVPEGSTRKEQRPGRAIARLKADGDEARASWNHRRLFDEQFNSGEANGALRVEPVANADELLSIAQRQFLGAVTIRCDSSSDAQVREVLGIEL